MPQPDLVEADRAEELPGHPDLGFRVGDGKDLLDEIARQSGVLLLHPVGEDDIRGVAQPLMVGEHEISLQPAAEVSPAAIASAAVRPAASPAPIAKLTPSSHSPAARHMNAASPATSIPSVASRGMA